MSRMTPTGHVAQAHRHKKRNFLDLIGAKDGHPERLAVSMHLLREKNRPQRYRVEKLSLDDQKPARSGDETPCGEGQWAQAVLADPAVQRVFRPKWICRKQILLTALKSHSFDKSNAQIAFKSP